MHWGFHRLAIPVITRLGASGIQFLLSYFIARFYGPAILGDFTTYISYTVFIGSFLSLGLPTLIAREVSVKNFTQNGTRRDGNIYGLIFVIVTVLCLAIYVAYTNISHVLVLDLSIEKDLVIAFSILSGGVYALLILLSESLKGIERIQYSLAVEFYSPSMLFILLLFFAEIVRIEITTGVIIFSYMLALLLSFFYAVVVVLGKFKIVITYTEISSNIDEIARLWGIRLLNAAYPAAPYFVLPFYVSASQVGLFSAAHKLVALLATLSTIVSAVYMAKFSNSYYNYDDKNLNKYYFESKLVLAALATPPTILYVFYSESVLSFFGGGFLSAATILIVLASLRYISLLFGPTETFLNMTGHASFELKSAAFSICVFFVLAYLFMGKLGSLGAAISFGVALLLRTIVSKHYINSRIVHN